MEDNNERLLAFCSVPFDDAFVVRDLKTIEGTKGSFVAMPSRKLTDRYPGCGCKNHHRARFCNQCRSRLDEERAIRDADGRAKLHADIAHPINSACREVIQGAILKSYREEKERAKLPGYVCNYDEVDAGEYEDTFSQVVGELNPGRKNGAEYHNHGAHAPRGGHGSRPANGHENGNPVSAHKDDSEG